MVSIPESLVDKIPEMSYDSLWDHFKLLEPEQHILEKVKYGVNVKFDVRVLTNGFYEAFPKTQQVRVHGYGVLNLYEFLDEMEERKDLMLNYIYEHYNEDVTKGRVDL